MEYGLIGEKLGHSFSKIVHNKLCDYDYKLNEVSRDNFHEFMSCKDFKAINVTIPYKQDIIPYLDEISDTAERIGAVNTIINKDGKLFVYNTDFLGLVSLIKFANIEIKDKNIVLILFGDLRLFDA